MAKKKVHMKGEIQTVPRLCEHTLCGLIVSDIQPSLVGWNIIRRTHVTDDREAITCLLCQDRMQHNSARDRR